MKIENIKFKAKRLDNEELVKGSFVAMKIPALEKTTIGIVVEGGATLHEVDPSTICQFTGLKDCKGKEIFENDLIHFVGHKPIAEVIWSEDDYAFMVVSDMNLFLLSDVIDIDKIERVGCKFDKEK